MSDAQNVTRVVKQVSKLVHEMSGIQLGEKQFPMVESRLKSRIAKLGLESFGDYAFYLESHFVAESQALLSLLTTHHTYFFREFSHFEYLLNDGLPELIARAKQTSDKTIRIWCAACSRGQEAYSLAMFFDFHLKEFASDVKFEIWASDVDPESVQISKNGVYKSTELKQVPAMYAGDHWIKGTGTAEGFSKVKAHLKSKIKFTSVNLLSSEQFLNGKKFDLIFCRNVFIYFNADQIKLCLKNFLNHLEGWGSVFLGVSESLNGLGLPVETVAPSVYKHQGFSKTKTTEVAKPAVPVVEIPKVLKVLCVDDSAAIHALLKKVFLKEEGFEIVGSCKNGLEALQWCQNGGVADVITLDIHMPELDGVGFLEKSQGLKKPPVLILSSVNREDPALGKRVLELGAFDYVEKPSLENLGQASNEIRAKVRLAVRTKKQPKTAVANSSDNSKNSGKRKVLIVDDSATIRQLLKQVISEDVDLTVVAEAEKPSQVEALIQMHKPDVITMDIQMPEMDGVSLLKKIFPKYRIPTVMISSISKEEGPQVLTALESGAVDYIQKPSFKDLRTVAQDIRDRIKTASMTQIQTTQRSIRRVTSKIDPESGALILLGASTGGTEALGHVLRSLPEQIPPILIVQHIPPVFSAAFAHRLNQLCPFEVKEAEDGDEVMKNRVLIAPGGKQMGIKVRSGKLFVDVNNDGPVNRHKPSVDYLFQSASQLNHPHLVVGLLTGMGADGARGMKILKDQGHNTVAQDQKTCVVFGMPREAIERGGAVSVKPLDQIAETIMDWSQSKSRKKAPVKKTA